MTGELEQVPQFRKAAIIMLCQQYGLSDVVKVLKARNEAGLPWTMDWYAPIAAQIQAAIDAAETRALQRRLSPPPKVGWLP